MPPTTCADLLRMLTTEPGRPRITWYGDAGERVELSGAVLENWVTKTTNLLVEEFDVEPGTRVLLDLPPHWRSVVWALATWRSGACVVTPEAAVGPPPELTVTDDPGRHQGSDPLVVVSLPALSRRYDGVLPSGAVDAASAVMTYGDVLGSVPAVDPDAPALVDGASAETHGDLFRLSGTMPDHAPRRALHEVEDRPLGASLRAVLEVLGAGGSVVLVSGESARGLRADPERRRRLIASERVTSDT
ncbi:MAG TPA: TIGR03089 family protein [Cellulomonadaceae bacterium]|nr:TIGR03089 family protein [Cellulomonadaceae bacterium]